MSQASSKTLKDTWEVSPSQPTYGPGISYAHVRDISSSPNGHIGLWETKCQSKRVVVKIGKRPRSSHSRVRSFMETLKDENHSRIIQIIKFEPSFPVVGQDRTIMEFSNGGDLYELVVRWYTAACDTDRRLSGSKECEMRIPESFIFHVFYQVSQALAFLHEGVGRKNTSKPWTPIVHRDIKPDNILLHHDQNPAGKCFPSIKLADLDFAEEFDADTKDRTVGTWGYAAPEITEWKTRNPMTPAADVWSLAGSVLFLATGYTPREMFYKKMLFLECEKAEKRFVWVGLPGDCDQHILEGGSGTLNDLLNQTLRFSPDERCSASSIARSIEDFQNTREYRKMVQAKMPQWAWKIEPDPQIIDQVGFASRPKEISSAESHAAAIAPADDSVLLVNPANAVQKASRANDEEKGKGSREDMTYQKKDCPTVVSTSNPESEASRDQKCFGCFNALGYLRKVLSLTFCIS